jgi:hypothetical protein
MRSITLGCALAALVAATACGRNPDVSSENVDPPDPTVAIPKTIGCPDAPGLRERATSERRRADGETSDQPRIVLGTRANYFASLAVFAELSCRTTAPEAEAALTRGLDAAREAVAAISFYEKVGHWSAAQSFVTEAIAALVREGEAPATRE